MSRFIVFGILSLLVLACTKDQRVVRIMSGKWKLSKIDNLVVSGNEIWDFSNCRLKNDTYCDLVVTNPNGDKTYLQYKMREKGMKMDVIYLNQSIDYNMSFTVLLQGDFLQLISMEQESVKLDFVREN